MKLFQKLINLVKQSGINANKIELSANDILNLLAGNEINLGSKSITIKSNNFSVDANGNATMSNVTIKSGKIKLDKGSSQSPSFQIGETTIMNDKEFYIGNFNAAMQSGNQINMQATDGYPAVINLWSSIGETEIALVSSNSDTSLKSDGITTPVLTQTSLATQKKNFEKMSDKALEILKQIDIYKYNLKSEKDTDTKHIGFVIGDKYNYSKEVTSLDNKGVDNYSFTSLCCKAIQEQQEMIEKLENRIKEMEDKLNEIN